jgi:hypothetical protein
MLFFFNSQFIFAQCGSQNESTFITSQEELNSLSICELFYGNLNITGEDIYSTLPLSNLSSISGSISIYDTSIESIEFLGNLMNALEINIYNNDLLSDCCAGLDWQLALDIGTIGLVNILSNAEGCQTYAQAQASCLGLIPGCTDANAVNYLALATFDDGNCLNGPDLQVSTATILNSLEVNSFSSTDECLVAEGCITGIGDRTTLRFTTSISNYGNEDFFIGQTGGVENLNPNFYWDDCHGHAHFEGYANYQIYTYPNLEPLGIGHKNGWCVMDLGGAISSEAPEGANYPSCVFTYGCSTMGISAGCSDTYGSGISCQWVDITDLYDGEYVLAVSTNMETDNYIPQYEIDFSNNIVYVLFEFEDEEIISASEFDGSSISDICSPDLDAIDLGFNFSDQVVVGANQVEMPSAFLNEFFNEPIQFVLTETINLNGEIVHPDSLLVNDIQGLPLGLNWACEPQDCTFHIGNSCLGINGIPSVSGSFEATLLTTLYFTHEGINEAIELPYSGGNNWLDQVLNGEFSSLNSLMPNINYNVVLPVYGCIDATALNYSETATFDDGTCEFPNLGCTDAFALNFDEYANTEDGSCEYCIEGLEWVAQIDLLDSYGDGWNGNSYYLINEWGDTTATGTLETGNDGTDLICLSPGCYVMSVPDENPWPYEISWEISSAGFPDVFLSGVCPDIQPFSFLTECEVNFGCMDTLAINFLESADFSDGSCTYPVYGCTDPLALNFNALATNDDDFCQYTIVCDESEQLYVLHLHDSYGDGWNGNDFMAINIDETALYETTMETGSESISAFCLNDDCYLISVDGGTWQEEITWELEDSEGNIVLSGTSPYQQYFTVNSVCDYLFGCTSSGALNFNELATSDDGSCEYPILCESGLNMVVMELQTDPYPGETSWDLITFEGDTLFASNVFEQADNLYTDSVCVANEASITFSLHDSYGDGLTSAAGNGEFHFYVCGAQVFSGSSFEYLYSGTFTGCDGAEIIVFGCMDALALNYTSDANTEDGSCEYLVELGCTDSEAINFNDQATDDDGTCEYISCEFYEMLVEVNLFASAGNGWEGLDFNLSNFSASYQSSGTLDQGFDGSEYFCLSNGCYLFTVPEYGGVASLNWSIIIEGKKIVSGTAGTKSSFGVNQVCEILLGCMDQNASNFEALANVSDQSCIYANGVTQEIQLLPGWNMVSSYLESENMDIQMLTMPFMSEIVIIKNNLGMAYLPDWGYNAIGDWDNLQGYQIKMNSSQTMEMTGLVIMPEQNPISLNAGWNMISYLRNTPAATNAVFEDISDMVVIVKNSMGSAYLPDWSFNGIGDMHSGQGYQVKMTADRNLQYLSNQVQYRGHDSEAVDNQTRRVHFELNTGSNMHLIIPKHAWPVSPSLDDEVYIYDAEGLLVGASRITLPTTIVTLWGDDQTTDDKDGLYAAEEWSMSFYSQENNVEQGLSISQGPVYSFQQDGLVLVESMILSDEKKNTALYNSVPNPARQETVITFYVNESQDMSLGLYNILGEEIQVLSSGFKNSGYHYVSLSVQTLEPGTYFYKLQTEYEKITKLLQVVE